MKTSGIILISLLILSAGVFAQEKAELTVKITKNGEVLQDTTYSYENIEQAQHALKMLEIMGDNDLHSTHLKAMSMDGAPHKKMVFISEDGAVHEFSDEGMTWVSNESEEGASSEKKYKIMIKEGSEGDKDVLHFDGEEGENIIINEDDGEVKVIIKKIGEGDKGENISVKKEVYVISGDDENINWEVKKGESGRIIIISEDGKMVKEIKLDGDKEINWSSKDGNEDAEVIVLKKEKVTNGDKMEIEVSIDDNEKEVKTKTGKKKKEK
jgi:hypothetical protein